MAILVVLLTTFSVTLLFQLISRRIINISVAGCISLATMFLFAGISHFLLDNGMVKMLPGWVPLKYPIIYITGIIELALGIAFLWPKYKRLAGNIAIIFLLCIFPSNVYAALNSVDFGGNLNGPRYLFFRLPLQLFLMGWAWFMAVRP